ncbi:hypothetical protein [Thiorhodococcus mannitoliphagus]|nr:hypothetical protein [Thiorhodococcus mannitoliphagus]
MGGYSLAGLPKAILIEVLSQRHLLNPMHEDIIGRDHDDKKAW